MDRKAISYWLKKPEWDLEEFVRLLMGEDPYEFEGMSRADHHRFEDISLLWMKRALEHLGVDTDEYYYFQPERMTTNPRELLAWAQTFDDVEIPSFLTPLLSSEPLITEPDLGDRNYNNLMATIGILALALAESKGPRLGSFENPNVSAIAQTCRDLVEELPPGLAQSSLRNRISKGVEILKEAMVC
jgi:hypothetical protein